MKDYYNVEDVREITKASKNLSYKIIRKLRMKFQDEYPDSITIRGKIPAWYFEKIMMNKEVKKRWVK